MTLFLRGLVTLGMLAAPFFGISAARAIPNIWMIPLGLAVAVVIGLKLLTFDHLRPIQQTATLCGVAGVLYGLSALGAKNATGWNFVCGGLALVVVLRPR